MPVGLQKPILARPDHPESQAYCELSAVQPEQNRLDQQRASQPRRPGAKQDPGPPVTGAGNHLSTMLRRGEKVEMAGIEPASVGKLSGLLRAQFVKTSLRSWPSHEHGGQRTELSKCSTDIPNICQRQWLPS